MTNIFIEELTYTTVEEYIGSSGLIIDEDKIKVFLRKAEIVLDGIIKNYGEKQDPNQNTIFPVKSIPGIPIGIKKATTLLANCLYISNNSSGNNQIIQETRRGKSVSYSQDILKFNLKNEEKYKKIHTCYNAEIHSYIEKYLLSDETQSQWFRT